MAVKMLHLQHQERPTLAVWLLEEQMEAVEQSELIRSGMGEVEVEDLRVMEALTIKDQ